MFSLFTTAQQHADRHARPDLQAYASAADLLSYYRIIIVSDVGTGCQTPLWVVKNPTAGPLKALLDSVDLRDG